MKIVVIGGNGTIGKTVVERLSNKHEVLIGSRSAGDVQVDIADSDSLEAMFETVDNVDAVVCIAGDAKWDKFENLSEEDFYVGIKSKLMGQVNLTRIAKDKLNENGSIALTTGILADVPVDMTTSASMVNGGIHSFVKAAALELKRGVRINAVASGLVEDAVDKYQDYFPGHDAIPMNRVVNGYVRCVEGIETGKIVKIYT